LEHIASFQANWEPKHDNIGRIAQELNLGVDSFVFADDNPAERAIVEGQVSGIAVPNIGDEVVQYASKIEAGRYFEQVSLSPEDLERAALYRENSRRTEFETKFANYGEYLDSLEMVAEIDRFSPLYLHRIAQLTNKTNQFNVTTRRYTLAEMEKIAADPEYLGLYCKLSDRFGDHGLISVVLGRRKGDALNLELWLMSCRVLKRDVELALLDALVERAVALGIARLYGYYLPTAKNAMVADLYARLGFAPCTGCVADLPEGATVWTLELTNYTKRNRHVRWMEYANG
jgi:FkbH-like protein